MATPTDTHAEPVNTETPSQGIFMGYLALGLLISGDRVAAFAIYAGARTASSKGQPQRPRGPAGPTERWLRGSQVVPAKAGTQPSRAPVERWVPAFAEMTPVPRAPLPGFKPLPGCIL